MGTIADYLQRQQELDQNRRQNGFNNLLNVANFAKDIWGTLSERDRQDAQRKEDIASYGVGGWRRNYAEFESGLKKGEAQTQLDLDKQLSDYNAKIADAKASGDFGRAMALETERDKLEQARAGRQHGYDMEEILANKSGAMTQASWDAYREAIAGAVSRFAMEKVDPTTGVKSQVWDTSLDPEAVRKFLYSYANMVPKEEQAALKGLFDQWIDQAKGAGPGTVGVGPGTAPPQGFTFDKITFANTIKTLKDALMIPGVNTAVVNTVSPQAVAALTTLGPAVVPAGALWGLYEAAKAVSGGATSVQQVEAAKATIKKTIQSILGTTTEPSTRPPGNAVRNLKE